MSKSPLVIVGTGLFAQLARDYFQELTDYDVVAFSCHERFKEAEELNGLPLLSLETLDDHWPASKASVFVAIGYNKMNTDRQAVYEEMKSRGYACASFVFPNVKIWNSSKLGDNVFIFEDNTVQPYTSIGNNTVLWSGNHIGHHSTVGDHCFISSHVVISGSCRVGNNVFMGVNATLHDSLTIGDKCLIGAGAIISKDTQPKEVFVPASTKPFPKNSEEIGF